MDATWLRRWNPRLTVRRGEETEFRSLGFCFYTTPMLCTYAESPEEMEIAVQNPAVTVLLTATDLLPRRGRRQARRMTYVLCDDPARVFYELHNHLATETDFYGSYRRSRIHPGARVDSRAHVDPVGVRIAAGAVVEPFATIQAGSSLGRDVIVRAGAVIGCEAAQMRTFGRTRLSMVHRGGVRVLAGAEIGVHAVVCASIFNEPTSIGRQAYLGPQVAIAHQVTVGAGALLLTGAIIFGTCAVEARAFIAPGAIISNGVTVGRRAFVSPGSLVTRDVPPQSRVTGYFATEHQEFLEGFRRLRGTR